MFRIMLWLLLCFLYQQAPKLAWSREIGCKCSDMVKAEEDQFLMSYKVGDLDHTIEFYTTCFDMQLSRRGYIPLLNTSYAFVGPRYSPFLLKMTHERGVDSIHVSERTNYRYLGVISDDVNKMVSDVVAKGGDVKRFATTHEDGITTASVLDPNGYLIEISNTNQLSTNLPTVYISELQ